MIPVHPPVQRWIISNNAPNQQGIGGKSNGHVVTHFFACCQQSFVKAEVLFIFANFVAELWALGSGLWACLLEIRQAFGLGLRPSAKANMVVPRQLFNNYSQNKMTAIKSLRSANHFHMVRLLMFAHLFLENYHET
jgi:hypothetical protein